MKFERTIFYLKLRNLCKLKASLEAADSNSNESNQIIEI